MNPTTSNNSIWWRSPVPGLTMVYIDHALDGTVPSKGQIVDIEVDVSHSAAVGPSIGKTQSRMSLANNGSAAERAGPGRNITEVQATTHNDEKVVKTTAADSSNATSPSHTTKSAAPREGLFKLPPEVRVMIWKLCIPGPRELVARPRYGFSRKVFEATSEEPFATGNEVARWIFRLKPTSSPLILQICKESRAVALRRGRFAFKGRLAADTGFWWNPNQDTLLLDEEWTPRWSPWSLQGLQGLAHVKHVAIESVLAQWYMFYEEGYAECDTPPKSVAAYRLSFRSTPTFRHPVTEFFKHIKSFSIQFPWHLHQREIRRRSIWGTPNVGARDEDTDDEESDIEDIDEGDPDDSIVTFRLGCDIETAELKLRKYANLCRQSNQWYEIDESIQPDLRALTEHGVIYPIIYAIREGDEEDDINWSTEFEYHELRTW